MSTDTMASIGNAADDARRTASNAADELGRKGRVAAESAGEAATQLDTAVRDAIRQRPYTALAIAGGLGFLYAAVRR